MTIMDELVRYIKETQFETIPEEVVEHAKKRIIDVIGCAIAGSKSPAYPAIIDLVREWGGKEESTILAPNAGKVPAHNAAMVNGVLASAFDFDPCGALVEGKSAGGHNSSTTIPTALAVAEQKAAGGKELLTALILGDDITSRMLVASDYAASKGITAGWDAEGGFIHLQREHPDTRCLYVTYYCEETGFH